MAAAGAAVAAAAAVVAAEVACRRAVVEDAELVGEGGVEGAESVDADAAVERRLPPKISTPRWTPTS